MWVIKASRFQNWYPQVKQKINDKLFEVHSKQGMIENNVNIEVSKIEANKIIVKKLN